MREISNMADVKFYIIEYKPTLYSEWKQLDYFRGRFDELCAHMKSQYNAIHNSYRHDYNGGYIEYFEAQGRERYKAYEE